MKFSIAVLAIGAMVVLTCECALAADKQQEGAALLAHASQLTNLRTGE